MHTRTSSGFHNNGAWKRDFPLLRAVSKWSTYYLANLLIYRVKVRAFKQNIRNFFLLGVHIRLQGYRLGSPKWTGRGVILQINVKSR